MNQFFETLIALGTCVALPISITWIIVSMRNKRSDNNCNLIMKAIETGNCDPVKLAETLGKSNSPTRSRRDGRLLRACIFSLIGLAIIIWAVAFNYFNSGGRLFWQSLILGMAFLAIGVSYLIVYYYSEDKGNPRQ